MAADILAAVGAKVHWVHDVGGSLSLFYILFYLAGLAIFSCFCVYTTCITA